MMLVRCRSLLWVALAFASWIGAAYAAAPEPPGRQIFERRCRTCHGDTIPADLPIGPGLNGIIGRKAGTQSTGVYSRALIDSGIVWDRESLRRFLDGSSSVIPDSHASFGQLHPTEIETLLDYLERLSDPDRNQTPR